jgi:tetratricopeptide (TPR) repeat protein
MHFLKRCVGLTVAALAVAGPQPLSSADGPVHPKDQFVLAIRQFLEATAGRYGDEQAATRAAIDAMRQALVSWDQAVLTNEVAAAGNPSPEGFWSLGLVYLDRRRVADALKEFDRAEPLAPDRPEIQTFRGFAYDLLGETGQATASFAKAAALNPTDPASSYRLAQHLEQDGRSEEAEKAWQQFRDSQLRRLTQGGGPAGLNAPFIRVDLMRQAPNVAPIFPAARYRDAFTAIRQGRYDDAVARLKEAAESDPLLRFEATAAAEREGRTALRAGRLSDALLQLKAAADASPEAAETRRVLGMAYWADDQYDAAAEAFATAIRLQADDERARVALGDVLVAAGKLGAAELAFKDAIAGVPDSGQAHYELGRLYEFQQRWQDAVEMFEAAAARYPVVGLDYLYQTIVRMYVSLPDFDKAIDAARRRVTVNPNNDDAHRALGDLLLRQGRHDEALTEMLAALFVNARNAGAYSGMAQVYVRTGRFSEAVEASRRAIDVDPGNREARYALATALARSGRTDEGANELARFEELQAEANRREQNELEAKMLQQEISTSLAREDYDAAIAALEKAIPLDPRSPSSYLNLAAVLKKSGRIREAIENLNKALALKAGPDAYRLLAEAYDTLGESQESQKYRRLYDQAKAERLRSTGWTR